MIKILYGSGHSVTRIGENSPKYQKLKYFENFRGFIYNLETFWDFSGKVLMQLGNFSFDSKGPNSKQIV